MSQSDSVGDGRTDSPPPVDDDGVRVRGQHWNWSDGPPGEFDDPLPGLWVGHADGCARHLLEIQEFGDGALYPRSVIIEREEIPKVVETLLGRAYSRDLEYLRERVDVALEELGDSPRE